MLASSSGLGWLDAFESFEDHAYEHDFPGTIPPGASVGANGSFVVRVDPDTDIQPEPLAPLRPTVFAALQEWQQRLPSLDLDVDSFLGVPSTLFNGSGFLSPKSTQAPVEVVRSFLSDHRDVLGLELSDLAEITVSSQSTSDLSGLEHVYLQQRFAGIDVFGGVANFSLNSDGQILIVGNSLVPNLARTLNTTKPALSPQQAVAEAARSLGLVVPQNLNLTQQTESFDQSGVIDGSGLSRDPIPFKLTIVPQSRGEARLAWNTVINMLDEAHWFEVNIDAQTGEPLGRFNWTDFDSYRVFPVPLEHPLDGPGLPSSHALLVNPANNNASPFGWHDTNGIPGAEFFDTRGNNVNAQEDRDGNNIGGSRPSSPTLDFDFAFDPASAPSVNVNQATVNLFYWNNIVHDVMALNGFNAAAGNFQLNNYGAGGLGGDPVQADAQDAAAVGAVNNANFATPRDGLSPRMQMFEFSSTTPRRDSDNDAGIIVHEYAHGISNRLVGGPANVVALEGIQSGGMGEGWSDFYSLVFTANSTDTASASYPVGTYVLGQPANGTGIRRFPYSTNKSVNPLTYDDIDTAQADVSCPAGCSEVHNVGEIWTSVLWDMYWILVNRYGFDANLYSGVGGNNLALKLVTEGMKLTPASPTMLQARDGILAADLAMNAGANVQEIWTAFAGRGMGFSAQDGGNHNAVSVSEAFDLPAVRDGNVEFNLTEYQIGDVVSIVVRDLDIVAAAINVNVTSTIGDTVAVTLSRITNAPGVYRGITTLASGAPAADQLLQVAIGGRIDVTYVDAADGAGGINVMNTDSAQIGKSASAFEGLLPAASLMHVSRNNVGVINGSSGLHGYVYFAEAGQRISAQVRPTNPAAILTIQLQGGSSFAAPSVGQAALLPITAVNSDSQQTLLITSNIATGYTLEIARNYVQEIVDSADGRELAIDGSQLDLELASPITAGARRFAALGTAAPVLAGLAFVRSNNPSLFIDISNSGNPLNLSDDAQATITTTVGNSVFPAGSVTISNNGGIVAAANTGLSPLNQSLPVAITGAILVPLWDDIDGVLGNVYWEQLEVNGINTLIVQWHNRPHFDVGGAVTFQLQLFETGPVFARFAYADVEFGSADYDFGASATIGYQRNSNDVTQHSFRTPSIANGDVLDLVNNVPAPDVDEFTLNMTSHVGKPIDIVLAGASNRDFSGERVELLGPNGESFGVAVSTPLQSNVEVTNYDLGLLNFNVTIPGVYTLRVASTNTSGDYSLIVTSSLVFDSEPNQNSLSDPIRALSGNLPALGSVRRASGASIFDSRNNFNAAAPGLPIEDFEDGSATPGAIVTCSSPLNSATNDACFTPGEILPGIEIHDNPGPSNNGMVLLGRNVIGNPSIATGPQSFSEGTDIRFTNNNVQAVGMDVFINTPSIVGITVYGQSGVLRTSSVAATTTGSFWGIISDQPISRISLTSSFGELVDNIAFGGAGSDVDRYRINLNSGELVALATRTLYVQQASTPRNTLDPQLRLIHPDGTTVVATDLDSVNGRDARLVYQAQVSGSYSIEISAQTGSGEYLIQRFSDNIAPVALAFTRNGPIGATTSSDVLTFLATFNEPVTGVGAEDFMATGTTGLISVGQVSPTNYQILVAGGNLANLNGTVGLNFNSPTIFDLFGNPLPNVEPTVDETYLVDNAAPTAREVIVSNSTWSAAFIDSVDGGGTGQGNGLGYAVTQDLVIPNSGIDRLYIVFSEQVSGFAANRVQLLGVSVANYSNVISTVIYDQTNTRGEIRLSTPIGRDRVRIGVADTVTDIALNFLDGDSNGSPGGPVNLVFGVLVGDANGDGSVNGGDLPAFAQAFNLSAGGNGFNPRVDWNSDGSVNGGDLPLFALNFNQSLPATAPGALSFGNGASFLPPAIQAADLIYGGWSKEEDEEETPWGGSSQLLSPKAELRYFDQ